jgi:hypothetical protein
MTLKASIIVIVVSAQLLFANAAEKLHWSLSPIKIAAVNDSGDPWIKNPIDQFVLAKLKEKNLRPQPEADRYTLMRRLHAGLTGILPDLEEINSFINTESDNAYTELVEKLLEDPHYGEKWARHWLDVARYGESDGILTVNEDRIRQNAWKYRDAVINSFNNDLSFDLFVKYQLNPRSDNISSDYKELRQFIHLGTKLQNNADPNDRQFHRLNDMVSTTGSAFLGFTFGCARCHDHPVDPMSTEEYYQFTSLFFDQFNENPIASSKRIPLRITEPKVLINGDWKSPGKSVSPGFLKVLMQKSADHWLSESNKMEGLGNWITDTVNGSGQLLARVIVNRLWHHHFGQGLVMTPNDFGKIGSDPTHPELLDWLSLELIENNWKLSHIHKLILTSAAYTQRNSSSPEYLTIDSDNRLLWHKKPQRLEAEIIRDRLLDVAGVLKKDMHGKSTPVGDYKKALPDLPKSWRRSIYLQAHRSVHHPTLSLFNYPDSSASVGVRSTSTGESSTLFSLNSKFLWTLSEHFAERIKKESTVDPKDRIKKAYMIALSRPPNEQEITIGMSILKGQDDVDLIRFCHLIFGLNEFIYIH